MSSLSAYPRDACSHGGVYAELPLKCMLKPTAARHMYPRSKHERSAVTALLLRAAGGTPARGSRELGRPDTVVDAVTRSSWVQNGALRFVGSLRGREKGQTPFAVS